MVAFLSLSLSLMGVGLQPAAAAGGEGESEVGEESAGRKGPLFDQSAWFERDREGWEGVGAP